MPTPSSARSRSRSVPPPLYFSWRATLTCLALARPRPIGSTPSNVRDPPGPRSPRLVPTDSHADYYRISCTADSPLRVHHMEHSAASASVHRQPYLFWAARASGGQHRLHSAAQPDVLYSAAFGHPPLREPVRSGRCGDVLVIGNRQD